MSHQGDYLAGATVRFKFTTVDTLGAPTTLGGGGLKVYRADSTTASASGVTLTPGFGGLVGLNHVAVDTSADPAHYTAATDFQVVITTGTVTGASVVGYTVGEFSVQNRYSAGLMYRGTLAGAAAATVTLTGGSFATGELNDSVLGAVFGTGKGQSRTITAQATSVLTLSPSFTTTPTGAVVEVWATPPATSALEARLSELDAGTAGKAAFVVDAIASGVNVVNWKGSAAATVNTAGYPVVTIKSGGGAGELNIAGGILDSVQNVVQISTGGITSASFAANAIAAAALASDAGTELAAAVWASSKAELSAVPAATSTMEDKLTWLFMRARNKLTQTPTVQTLYADNGTTVVATCTTTATSTLVTRGEFV